MPRRSAPQPRRTRFLRRGHRFLCSVPLPKAGKPLVPNRSRRARTMRPRNDPCRLSFDHLIRKAALPTPQARFERIEPIVENSVFDRLRRRLRDIFCHHYFFFVILFFSTMTSRSALDVESQNKPWRSSNRKHRPLNILNGAPGALWAVAVLASASWSCGRELGARSSISPTEKKLVSRQRDHR